MHIVEAPHDTGIGFFNHIVFVNLLGHHHINGIDDHFIGAHRLVDLLPLVLPLPVGSFRSITSLGWQAGSPICTD